MAFGTFDLLHPGHLNFLEQAKALGDFLIVSVSRDENAKKFKGRAPVFNERERLRLVSSLKAADKAILGSPNNYLAHIIREKPDIIALGYDQTAFVPKLEHDIQLGKIKVKIVRLKPYKRRYLKSSKLKEKIRRAYLN